MKKMILMTAFMFIFFGQTANAVKVEPDVSALSAIVYHADSERVLYERQADTKRLIASTTKIMTALIAIERCSMNETVMITEAMANVEGSSMYLQVGETYTVRELLYGLMLASGNDAATAIALHVAGDETGFAALMNEKAREIGMTNTCFDNPHGLDDTDHYSTAHDMAVLAAYAMNNEQLAEIVGTRHINIKNLTYVNHNKLLWQCEGVVGMKTGYTKAAGRTLVTCCERNGQRLICVTLSAPNDWNDHKQLYEWAYDVYGEQVVLDKDSVFRIPLVNGHDGMITAEPLTDVTVFANETDSIDYYIELPRFAFGPISKGDKAGQVVVMVNGDEVSEVKIVYTEDYSMNTDTPHGLKRMFQSSKGI